MGPTQNRGMSRLPDRPPPGDRLAARGVALPTDPLLALQVALQTSQSSNGQAAAEGAPLPSDELEARLLQFQKMEALGRAALGVAHEFNNLLCAVSAYAELLRINPVLNEEAQCEVEAISSAAARASDLAQQLLRFGRKRSACDVPVDLSAAVNGIGQMLSCLVGSGATLAVVPGPDPCPVRVSAGEIEQVLMNLVTDARDATGPGGRILVTTGRANLEQDFRHAHGAVPAGSYARLAVRDTGCGMDPVTLTRLFEPFYTTKEPGRGTGLGLAIVAAILHQSDGHITVWSERGRGTRFEVYWPLANH